MGERVSADARPRESAGGIVGVGVGLLVLLVLVGLTLAPGGQPLEGTELVGEVFAAEPLPEGLAVTEGRKLPGGTRVARLSIGADSPWAAGGAGPRELLLAVYRKPASADGQFQDLGRADGKKLAEWRESMDFDLRVPLEKGWLEFGDWEAAVVRERQFHRDGRWNDAARVNLSQLGFGCVLFAEWPDEVESDEVQLVPLLEALQLRAVEEEPEDAAGDVVDAPVEGS